MKKIIVILGPTASGKSTLGINLAKKYNGEIISADSRQVFKRLDIGSGKITNKEQSIVPHHLLDVSDPMDEFSVAKFQKLAFVAIEKIIKNKKLPFIVGGTALYIYSIVDNYKFQNFKPDKNRQKELESKPIEDLILLANKTINGKDYEKTKTKIEQKNPIFYLEKAGFPKKDIANKRRLTRAILKLESGIPLKTKNNPKKYNSILIGIDLPRQELYKKIDARVDERIKQGMIEEVKNLRLDGVSDEWLLNLGLEYRWITEYLNGKWTKEEMASRLKTAIHAFSRRQMTWWKKDKRIIWIKDENQAEKTVKTNLGL
jgi:tRNA dimethylallyltransferase